MTREQFFDLAQRVQAHARRHPRLYRWQVALFAAFGYAALGGMIAGCAGLLAAGGWCFFQPWFWETAGRNPRAVVACGILLFALAGVLFIMLRSLFVTLPVPAGRRVQRAEAPGLFALIDEVAAASRAPQTQTVLLTWEFNAAVCQRPRFGWFGWSRNYLLLGVPLMAALTPLQFKAVLAHEFGHLRGGDGRFGARIYRLRIIWDQIRERLVLQRRRAGFIVSRFLRWYTPRFSAYTFALARSQEFLADRWAAEVAGLPAAGEALVNIWTRSQQLQERFWQPLNVRACREAVVPRGVFVSMLSLLRGPVAREDQRRWLRGMLGRATDGTDSHPAPAERLEALGLPTTLAELDADEMWLDDPAPAGSGGDETTGEPSAARALLGARLPEHLDELENAWRVLTAPVWRKRFERSEAIRARLGVLAREAAAAPGGELPEATAWERASLEIEVAETPVAAIATVERFAACWPGHAAGRFLLGRMLLAEDRETGLAHLEEAMRLDARFAAGAQEAIAEYLRRGGQAEEAAARRRLAVRHGDTLDAGHAERRNVTPRDRFLPHGLASAEVAGLRAQLARHPRIWKVWVARKEVLHYPERPWYVVVCVFKWRWNEFSSTERVRAILGEIQPGLTVAGRSDFYFYLVSKRGRNVPLACKVRKASKEPVYPAPLPKRRFGWWGARQPEGAAGSGIPNATALSDADLAAASALPSAIKSAGASLPSGRATELPPPLPRPPARVPLPPARTRDRVRALTACAVFLVVTLPLGYVVYRTVHSPDAWRRLVTAWKPLVTPRGGNGMLAEARRPIPRDPQATTQETDRRLKLAWAQRTMLAGFDHCGRRNPRWNTSAHAFIARALPWWAGLHDCTVTAAQLVPDARNLLRAGCDDPLVLYLAGLAEERADRQSPAAGALFTRAVTGFQTTPYPRGVALAAVTELASDCKRRRDGTGQIEPVKQWWLVWFKQALRDGSFSADEQPVLAGMLAHGEGAALFEEQRAACCQAVDDAGDRAVAPWLRFWLAGTRHRADAWAARGDDVAAKVTAAGWRGFASGLSMARADLVASWQLNPRRPEAAAGMITVALGENQHGAVDGPRAWFDRAVSAQVDYEPAYTKMFMALLPQWGGSREAVLEFGLTCAATTDYDTSVPMQLNEAARRLDPAEGYGRRDIYAALGRMYAGYEAAPSQAGCRVWYHGWHARAAELTGRYTEAYELLKAVDFALARDLSAELAENQESSNYVERIAAYAGPGGAEVQAGDRLVQRGRTDRALESFRAALAAEASGADAHATAYVQSRIDKLEREHALAAGDWVSFQPAAGAGGLPLGWTTKLGSWRVAADGTLFGQAGASGLMLVSDARVGADFEVRGELEFLPGAPSEQQSGVVFGHPDMESDDWQSFRLKRNGPDGAIATVSCHWYDGPKQPLAVPDRNTFALQSRGGQITLTVNGRVVFSKQRLDRGWVSDNSVLVGLGGYSHHGAGFAVAYRKLEIRRLL